MNVCTELQYTVLQFTTNSCLMLQFLVKDEKYGQMLCQSTDESGNTPLHTASERGNLEAVKILLDHGGSASVQNKELETPMHLAAVTGMEQ